MVYVKGIIPLYKWQRIFRTAFELGLDKQREKALNRVPPEFREEGTPYTRRVTLEELLRECIEARKIDELLNASREVGSEIREVTAGDSKDQTFGFTPRTSSLGGFHQLRMRIDLEVIPINPLVSVGKYPLTRAQVSALLQASPSLFNLVPHGLFDKFREVRTDDLPLKGMNNRRFIIEICRILDGRLLSPDEWMSAAGVQNVDSLDHLLGSKSLREGSFPVGMPEGAVSPLGFRDIYDNSGVEVVSGMMDRTLLAMGVAPGEKEHKFGYYNEGRKIDESPAALVTEDSFPLGMACLRIAFFGLDKSTSTKTSEIITTYTKRGEPFGIGWRVPLWLFRRDKYISGLKNLSKNIGKAGAGDKVINFKSGQACVIVQCNKEKSEFVISSGLRDLFSIRGIREIQIKDVSSDELFSVLRIAMRMRKEELLRGFIKSYTSSIILRSKKNYISVVLSKEGGLKKGVLTIEKLPELNGG